MIEAAKARRMRLLAAGEPPTIESLWRRVHERVLMQAMARVPYEDDRDSWHGPNAAIGHAAFNAALVGISGALGVDSIKTVLVANGR